MRIKEIIKKIILGKRADSDSYVAYLRSKGMIIGEDCTIYVPTKTLIDEQYPWMIEIGSHVRITQGCILLTHDYSWSVMKLSNEGQILGASGKIIIGDNVFIGMNSIILRGVSIGSNVIIGAGSVVTKDCEPNMVYAGNPAKPIMALNDFIIKRQAAQIQVASALAKEFQKKFGEKPPKSIFHEYFQLFETGDSASQESIFRNQMQLGGNYKETIDFMNREVTPFHSFDQFLQNCLKE